MKLNPYHPPESQSEIVNQKEQPIEGLDDDLAGILKTVRFIAVVGGSVGV